MGTFYNSRALEWFECGRTEHLRAIGVPYADMERRGVLLPLIEAHVEYLGRARYDDELAVATTAALSGRARLRFDIEITHAAGGAGVARGYTVHAIAGPEGRAIRPPAWLAEKFAADDNR
jgi:acyl-CoA thioester hydrolase